MPRRGACRSCGPAHGIRPAYRSLCVDHPREKIVRTARAVDWREFPFHLQRTWIQVVSRACEHSKPVFPRSPGMFGERLEANLQIRAVPLRLDAATSPDVGTANNPVAMHVLMRDDQ